MWNYIYNSRYKTNNWKGLLWKKYDNLHYFHTQTKKKNTPDYLTPIYKTRNKKKENYLLMASSSLSLCFSLVSASLDSFSAKRRLSICLTVLWNVNLFPLGLGFDWKSTKAGKSVERLRQHLRNAWENERRVRTGRQSEEQSSALRQEPLEKPLLKLPPLCPRASWTVGFFESKTTISEMRRTAFCVGRDKEARFGARQREIRTGTPARFRSLGCSVPFFFVCMCSSLVFILIGVAWC